MPNFKRLNPGDPAAQAPYRGAPLHNPPKVAAGAPANDSAVAEAKLLKKQVKALEATLENEKAEKEKALEQAAAAPAEDKEMLDGIEALKEEVSAAKDAEKKALAEKSALESKVQDAEAAVKAAEEAATAPTPPTTPDLVFVAEVSKVRPVDDDLTKVYCKLSLERDGEAIDGVIVVPNAASKYLKRIGS